MANYFVSTTRGNDSTGTGTATSPWQTIGKAIGSSPAITLSGSGADRLYVEPGIYYESVTLGLSPTSTNTFEIIGDCDGAGFYAGGYSTPVVGPVEWAGYTNESTAATAATTFAAFSKNYVTLKKFIIRGSATSANNGTSAIFVSGTWNNWTIQDCEIEPASARTVTTWFDVPAGTTVNLLVDRCHFTSYASGIAIEIRPAQHTAEYNAGITIQNCRVMGGSFGVRVTSTGSSTNLATGITIQNVFLDQAATGISVYTGASGVNLTTPFGIYNSSTYFATTAITAGNTTQVVEDYNVLNAATPRANVSVGTHSLANIMPRVDRGSARLYGVPLRPYGEPMPGSSIAAIGNGGTPPTVDFSNRTRAEGFGSYSSSASCFERHDTATLQTGTVQAGSAAFQISGPGSQEWLVPVAASATTLTIYTRADTNYSTATTPVFEMDAEPLIGVSALSTSAPSNTNTWNQLSLGPFTPAAAGWVRVRVKAKPNAANGICFIDTFGGATGDPGAMGAAYRGAAPRFLASNVTNNIINVFNTEC